MKKKNRKKCEKDWAEFQAAHRISDEALALIRQVHGRVAELMRSFPNPPPDSVEDWLRAGHQQWFQHRAQAAAQPSSLSSPKQKNVKFDPAWAKAKQVCRLNQSDVAMAKRLGISPQSLMKNSPSPSQPWKAPVKEWIHQLYADRFGRHPPVRDSAEPSPSEPSCDDVPF